MRLELGTTRRLVVIAPHPDDEAIAAHTLIARSRRRGVMVRVVVVTDGAASHPNSRRWPRQRLVAERQRESRRVLRRIGVMAGAISFLKLPDGRLHTRATAARRGVARVVGHGGATVVVAPVSVDDHADHRTVAASVARLQRPGMRVLGYRVWPAGRRLLGARALFLTSQERLAKRRAIRSYRTQAGAITDDPEGFAMTRSQIAAFTRPSELFVKVRR